MMFEHGGNIVINFDDEEKKEVDECILDVKCDGDCDEVVHQAEQLRNMQLQGGRRDSPQEKSVIKKVQRCPQCNLVFQKNTSLQKHVKENHGLSCPFCQIGFFNQNALNDHIGQAHSETLSMKKTDKRPSKGPCAFFKQPRGCKKCSECDYSHENSAYSKIEKIPKLCRNSRMCNWKPRCRYVHPEDGETFPQRASRMGGSSGQGFGSPRLSRPPPGFSQVPRKQEKQVHVLGLHVQAQR